MKKSRYFFLLLLFAAMASCQTWPTKEISDEFEKIFDVDATTAKSFTRVALKDCAEDKNYNKYGTKINGITLERVTWQLTAFTAPAGMPQTISGFIGFKDPEDLTQPYPFSLTNFENIDLASLLNKETDLMLVSSTREMLEYLLTNKCKILISINIYSNRSPVKLTMKLKFYTKTKVRIIGKN